MAITLEGLNEDFRDLLVLFVDAVVEFVVVGAYALAFHGPPAQVGTSTSSFRPSAANAQRVVDALGRFSAPLASAGVNPADFAQPGAVYQIGLPPRRIDVMTEISDVMFDEAWASRVTAEVEGRTVGFIGREALLRNKEATGRLQDRADA